MYIACSLFLIGSPFFYVFFCIRSPLSLVIFCEFVNLEFNYRNYLAPVVFTKTIMIITTLSLSHNEKIRICASFVRYKMEYKAINLPANRESHGSVFFF